MADPVADTPNYCKQLISINKLNVCGYVKPLIRALTSTRGKKVILPQCFQGKWLHHINLRPSIINKVNVKHRFIIRFLLIHFTNFQQLDQ